MAKKKKKVKLQLLAFKCVKTSRILNNFCHHHHRSINQSSRSYHDHQVDHHVDRHFDRHVGVHPKSHKHFIPYMGFCASIWDIVRHHCHHHHDHQK